jgi:hypothetical protein
MVNSTKPYRKETNFLTLEPANCSVREKASNLKTEYVIMCCLVRAITHFRGNDEYQAMAER